MALEFFMQMVPPTRTHQEKQVKVVNGRPVFYEPQEVKAARQKLTGLMQERKMHEKLKEHAFEAFMQDEKKREGKEVDELTSYTYGQKKMEAMAET